MKSQQDKKEAQAKKQKEDMLTAAEGAKARFSKDAAKEGEADSGGEVREEMCTPTKFDDDEQEGGKKTAVVKYCFVPCVLPATTPVISVCCA